MFEIIRRNPKLFVIAVLIHALLFALLSFNLDWTQPTEITPPQVDIVQAVMVDDAKVKVAQRQAEEKQRKEEERLRREAEQLEKLEFEQETEQRRADEAKKEAQARQQREAEEKRSVETRQKREAEEKRTAAETRQKREAEEKRAAAAEADKRKSEAEKQRKAEEEHKQQAKAEADKKRRLDEERKRQEAEEQRQLEALRRQEEIAADEARMQSARQRELDNEKNKYLFMIQQRVESKWLKPSGWQAGTKCTVHVRLVPGAGSGQVIDARITKSCGQPLFDRSVENAVFSASPLPLPVTPELMNQFRDIKFVFNPED